MVATVLRYVGLALTATYAVGCGAWLVSLLAHQPGGWAAALVVVGWGLPLAVLTALALLRPQRTGPALAWLSAVLVEFVLLAGSVGLFPHHVASRVSAVLVFVLAVSLGALGLHRPRLSGLVLLGLGVGYLVAVVGGTMIGPAPHAHGFLVRGWARPVGLPVPALALVFLVANLGGRSRRPRRVLRAAPGSGGVGDGRGRRPPRLQPGNRHAER